MKLGFVSAIVPDLSLEEIVQLAAAEGYDCIEVCCWPKGKAERRYAGVTHIDVTAGFARSDAARVNDLFAAAGVSISGLGYYPNPLSPDAAEAKAAVAHIKKVIRAAALLGVGRVNTFVGRDWTKSVDANWPRFLRTWRPLVKFAEDQGVRIGIENCPMLFSNDEWPGSPCPPCPRAARPPRPTPPPRWSSTRRASSSTARTAGTTASPSSRWTRRRAS